MWVATPQWIYLKLKSQKMFKHLSVALSILNVTIFLKVLEDLLLPETDNFDYEFIQMTKLLWWLCYVDFSFANYILKSTNPYLQYAKKSMDEWPMLENVVISMIKVLQPRFMVQNYYQTYFGDPWRNQFVKFSLPNLKLAEFPPYLEFYDMYFSKTDHFHNNIQ